MTQNNELLEAALLYASWGWPVLPCREGAKSPACAHGVLDATTDAAQIMAWWRAMPNANIGVACGERSGITVFDIDPRNDGDVSWSNWSTEHGALDDGATQLTAGGGQHHIADYTPDLVSCELVKGVDVLSNGRYFIASPSSVNGNRYEWEGSSSPLDGVAPARVSEDWINAIKANHGRKTLAADSNGGVIAVGGRNAAMAALGGAMRRSGFAEAEILAALAVANETRCSPPLSHAEIIRIAKSVARYAPDTDAVTDAALAQTGAVAINALLARHDQQVAQEPQVPEQSDYYMTRGTDFLVQPAPLKWAIKGWIPEGVTAMIFGESGAGKTFVALDIACCIASGINWAACKTKSGVVVYLAGEGNYGMRQRVASWAKKHGVSNLDNFIVSNRGIGIDAPDTAARIIHEVRALTDEPVSMVFIDTLNTHMLGEENSAKEARAFLNACSVVASALQSGVVIIHHTGNAAETKNRARGSSAWKGALDASILVVSDKNDGAITVSCVKMKDAVEPQALTGRLSPVPLGWLDEDGEEVIGAVFELGAQQDSVGDSKPRGSTNEADFLSAWQDAGSEMRSGVKWLSRANLISYLCNTKKFAEATAKKHCKAGGGGIIQALTIAHKIIPVDDPDANNGNGGAVAPLGWLLVDVQASIEALLELS